jgi:hypothetical protein
MNSGKALSLKKQLKMVKLYALESTKAIGSRRALPLMEASTILAWDLSRSITDVRLVSARMPEMVLKWMIVPAISATSICADRCTIAVSSTTW